MKWAVTHHLRDAGRSDSSFQEETRAGCRNGTQELLRPSIKNFHPAAEEPVPSISWWLFRVPFNAHSTSEQVWEKVLQRSAAFWKLLHPPVLPPSPPERDVHLLPANENGSPPFLLDSCHIDSTRSRNPNKHRRCVNKLYVREVP